MDLSPTKLPIGCRLEQENAAQRRELEALRANAAREARFRFRGCNHPVRTAATREIVSFSGNHKS
jgi:hypothetical protein